ncbi:MAG: alcohol dehydrogenase catalytic domain-containing protein [Gemmatimonadaceae bacterium]
MRALRLTAPGSPIELHDVPTPQAGDGEVLVRVHAAGICHSDAHYRSGRSPAGPLPLILGHEVAGVVESTGPQVSTVRPGDRVCLHYLTTCGHCDQCHRGNEQFCHFGSMLGHYRDGGWAEYIVVPERNAVALPEEIPFEHGAALMCSAATSFHALRKSRLKPGETVAIFGTGGLGMAAVQLAKAFGAREVYGVDIHEAKLQSVAELGAIPVDASQRNPVDALREHTGGQGVDVSVELIGLPLTMQQAVKSLAVHGRAVVAGLAAHPLEIDTYRDLLGREAEVIGANDHLLAELSPLIELVRLKALDMSRVVRQTVPLGADAVNLILDKLDAFEAPERTVIIPAN